MGPNPSRVLLVLLCVWFFRGYGLSTNDQALSAEEDRELERRLGILNKPPVKTVKMITGDVIDCIDIYKQPAFDHPLLKDHKIQMGTEASVNDAGSVGLFPFEGCPRGTIPIRRTTKEDLIREKNSWSLDKVVADVHANHSHHAGINIVNGTSYYYEGKATLNIWSPKCTGTQLSASLIRLGSGPRTGDSPDENGVYAGLAVNPALYGDDHPRFFIYWKGRGSTGCFDLRCPGFIQTDSRFVLGVPLLNISKYGGVQHEFVVHIAQETYVKDWWVILGNGIRIGYWPRNILLELNDGATRLSFGGLTIADRNTPSPPMGSSHLPKNNDLKRSGYMREIQFSGLFRSLGYPGNNETTEYFDSPRCYGLKELGYVKNNGYVILFGGPGGSGC